MAAHPSEIVVFDLRGSAPDFYAALRRINGLSWLLDADIGECEPDDLFYNPKSPESSIRRRVLAVSLNRAALSQLIQLFRVFKAGKKLPRNFGTFVKLFEHVQDVRPWRFSDRVTGTGLDEYLRDQIAIGAQTLTCTVELFSTGDDNVDAASLSKVSAIIRQSGQVLSSVIISEIRHSEIRAKITIGNIKSITELEQISVFRADEVMFVRPRAQALVQFEEGNSSPIESLLPQDAPLRNAPRLAMLDGVPVQNHPLLVGRLALDDPDGFESMAPAQQRIHATGMLSLALYGDLSDGLPPLSERIYVRPILLPRSTLTGSVEEIPDDQIPIDLVHRSIVRLFDGAAVAPTVRVICLCVGDVQRPLDWFASPWARLIDYLSWKYGVLFIISAGNHAEKVEIQIPSASFSTTSAASIDDAILRDYVSAVGTRPLLSPSEAINVVTIGAAAYDKSIPPEHITTPYIQKDVNLPATYSATGGGIGRMIKPEVFFPGGRQAYRLDPLSPAPLSRLVPVGNRGMPGHEVAAPPNSKAYLRGTSNSTALALRASAKLLDVITEAVGDSMLPKHEEIALLKAMLTHSATWGGTQAEISRFLPSTVHPTQRRNEVTRILGYGFPSIDRVSECTEARITVIAAGKIKEDRSTVYRFPLPPSLASKVAVRTMIVTLAFISPISVTSRVYRSHNVWASHSFRGAQLKNSLRMKTAEAHEPATERGTLQHHIYQGEAAVAFVDGDAVEIQVNCTRSSGDAITDGIPFGLVATLEVHSNVGVDLYNEVKSRVAIVNPVIPVRT